MSEQDSIRLMKIELMLENEQAEQTKSENEGFVFRNRYADESVLSYRVTELEHKLESSYHDFSELEIDRDDWTSRAMALERAIKQFVACETCRYFSDGEECNALCGLEDGYGNWQFDEERFAQGGGKVDN